MGGGEGSQGTVLSGVLVAHFASPVVWFEKVRNDSQNVPAVPRMSRTRTGRVSLLVPPVDDVNSVTVPLGSVN